jgi:dTDP-4-amino-4,6-dideoxygalactose transaminase
MEVPFLDLRAINLRHRAEFAEVQRRVLESGRVLFGDETASFERDFASYCGAKHCVLVANGLDALALSLRAWVQLGKLAPGDEVVVPTNSFVASALAVRQAGLKVRFADVDARTHNLSLRTLKDACTDRVRAVMPVHLYGRMAELCELLEFCRHGGLLLLEDAAQAHGAYDSTPRDRTLGDAAAFSFYPSKNLGALSDSGCVISNDPEFANVVRALGNYGSVRKYEHHFEGINSRTDELNAGFLSAKLRALDGDNAIRRRIADTYRARMTNPHVTLPAPPSAPHAHVWHLFVVETENRQNLVEHLASRGIETSVHYPRAIHRQRAFLGECGGVRAPIAERLQDRVLSLPISPVLSTEQIEWVVEGINGWQAPVTRDRKDSNVR